MEEERVRRVAAEEERQRRAEAERKRKEEVRDTAWHVSSHIKGWRAGAAFRFELKINK